MRMPKRYLCLCIFHILHLLCGRYLFFVSIIAVSLYFLWQLSFTTDLNVSQVQEELYADGYACDADVDDSDTMNKKIRNAQLAQYNFILGTHCGCFIHC